jgi:hypothetical protein
MTQNILKMTTWLNYQDLSGFATFLKSLFLRFSKIIIIRVANLIKGLQKNKKLC